MKRRFKKIKALEEGISTLKKFCGEFMPIGVHHKKVLKQGYINKVHYSSPKESMHYCVLGEELYKYINAPTLKENHLSHVCGMTVDIDHGELIGKIPDWREFIFNFVDQVEKEWGFEVSIITFSSGVGYDKPKKAHLHIFFPPQYTPWDKGGRENYAKLKTAKWYTAVLFEFGLIEYYKSRVLPPLDSIDSIELRGVVDLLVAERNWWISLPGSYNLKYGSPVKRVGFYKEIDESARVDNLKEMAKASNLLEKIIPKKSFARVNTSSAPLKDIPECAFEDANKISWDVIRKYKYVPPSVLKWVDARMEGKAYEWCGGEGHKLRLVTARYLEQNVGRYAPRLYFAVGHKLFSLMGDYDPQKTQEQLMWVYTHPFEGKIVPERHIDPLVKLFI